MAEDREKSAQEPNLELPSLLGFGRRKKRREADPAPEPATAPGPAADEATAAVATTPAHVDSSPDAADPVPPPGPGIKPAAGRAKRLPPVPPPPKAGAPAATATTEATAIAETAPDVRTVDAPATTANDTPGDTPDETTVLEATPEVESPPPAAEAPSHPHEEPVGWPDEEAPEEPGAPADRPVEEPVGRPVEPLEEPTGWPEGDDPDEEPVTSPVQPGARRAARSSMAVRLPAVHPGPATVVTGVVVGLVGVLLAFVALRGCEFVRGVGSCGGIGVLALLVILAVEVLLGAALLKAWRLSDATTTSFLGVGLVAVFVLLFLLTALESVWMVLVIPALTGMAYLLSWWVTNAFVEGADNRDYLR